MKKLLCLLLVIICGLMLWSCQGTQQTPICYSHTDADDNLRCDDCGEKIDCTKHIDVNDNLACDKCGKTMKCTHRDDNNDGVCDVKICGFILCEHEFDEYYSSDENYHWFANTCGCVIEPMGKAAHTDTNNDSLCDVCEWNYNHVHAYEENWSHNETQHWYNVTCGHNIPAKSLGDHVDENNDGLCDGCGWDYGHTHTYEDAWSYDDNEHWHNVTCEHNIELGDRGPHTDENNDGLCDGCGWDYGHVHEYADEDNWTSDETGHWHAAICGHNVPGADYAEHKENDGICEICEYVLCDNHIFIATGDNVKWNYDNETHWILSECGHASAAMEPAGHSYVTTKDGWSICKCGYCPHYTSEYSFDKVNHWFDKNCDCEGVEAVSSVVPHVDEDNNGICDVCLYQFCEHFWGAWQHEGDYHWQKKQCSHVAPEASEPVLHTATDENNDGICDACTVQYCAHNFRSVYSYDTEYHWFAATCGHSVEDQKAMHTDDNNDGACDVCLYQYCEHTYNPESWGSDAEWHWNIADCTHDIEPINKAKHVDTDNDGICDVCNRQTCYHGERIWATDDINHWRQPICGHTGIENTDLGAHVDETGGVNGGKDGICDTCKYVMCEHTYDDKFTPIDADGSGKFDYHGRLVTCGCDIMPADYMTHRDSEEKGNADGYCDYCYTLGENSIREYFQYCKHENDTGVWEYNSEYHWKQITCCDIGIREKHVDTDNNGVCEVCTDADGNFYQFCYHWNIDEWAYDTHEHWHARTCTHSVDERIHVSVHDDVNFDEICDICKHYCEVDDDSFGDNGSAGTTEDNLTTPVKEDEDENL